MFNIQRKKIISNDRSIIKPYELDVFITELNIAFEYDGLYWHSDEILKNKNKPPLLSLYKTKACEEKGIKLIHIFEDDWIYSQNIVKSIIKNLLHENIITINTNECIIKEISQKEALEFLTLNSIQEEPTTSKINIGLYYNNILMQLLTVKQISNRKMTITNICSRLDTNIINNYNTFSLIKNTYNLNEIILYTNYRWNEIDLYKSIGFKILKYIPPSCWYMNDCCLKRYSMRVFETNILKEKLSSTKVKYRTIHDCGYVILSLS